MKILKKLFGGNSKIHVDEIAVTPDMLLGKSVIVESVTTAEANWIKYGDGTMIVWYQRSEIDITDVPNGTNAVVILDNPVNFHNTPAVFLNGYFTNANGDTLYPSIVPMLSTGTVGNKYLSFAIQNATGTTITKVAGFSGIAFGKWK